MVKIREIKFRAWDKLNKELKEVWKIEFGVWVFTEPFRISNDIAWEDAELIQYTGLKDKDGNEIFEGHILKYLGRESPFVIQDIRFDCEAIRHKDDLEIIGNIWENPELLKEK